MSYYSDLDNDLGAAEEAEEHHREYELEQRQKKKSFDNAVAAEVKRQLAKLDKVKPESETNFVINHKNKKSVSLGLQKEVKCKCCQRPFMARVADLNRGWGKFCSKSCKAKKQESQTGQFKAYLTRSLR